MTDDEAGSRAVASSMQERPRYKWPLLLLFIAVVEHVVAFILNRHLGPQGEAELVARAVATKGSIADPFPLGGGPTVHLTPSMVLVEGAIYRLFGVDSQASAIVAFSVSTAICVAGYAAFYVAAKAAGMPRKRRLVALAVLCLVPLNVKLEVITFRVWEGGLAALIAGLGLLLIVRMGRRAELRWPMIALLLGAAAVLTFVNLIEGLALYSACAILFLRRFALLEALKASVLALTLLAAVLAPWTIRNFALFDRFIPLRGNAGLELALGNYPGALGKDDHSAFVARLHQLHPTYPNGFRAMQRAGGEIPYSAALGSDAERWIVRHPAAFARLYARHLRQYYFRPAWEWHIYAVKERNVLLPQSWTWAVSLFGLFGAAIAFAAWRDDFLYFACLAVVPGLLYATVQPVPRYSYLVYAPLVFLAVQFLCEAGQFWRRRRNSRERSPGDGLAAASASAARMR